jgi:hypothetical protein
MCVSEPFLFDTSTACRLPSGLHCRTAATSELQFGRHARYEFQLSRQDSWGLLRRPRDRLPNVPRLCESAWCGGEDQHSFLIKQERKTFMKTFMKTACQKYE